LLIVFIVIDRSAFSAGSVILLVIVIVVVA